MERGGQIVSFENEVSEIHNASIIRSPTGWRIEVKDYNKVCGLKFYKWVWSEAFAIVWRIKFAKLSCFLMQASVTPTRHIALWNQSYLAFLQQVEL